jgi:hypothetical protein
MKRIYSRDDLLPVINDIQLHLGLNQRQQFVEFYRGQGLDSYKLTNGLARFNHKPKNLQKRERKLFEKYKANVKSGNFKFIQEPYHKSKFKNIDDWFYLFQGQHLGLKTRLMDWSARWEVALLFAVENEELHGQDGQFWVFICPREFVINSGNFEDIYNSHPLDTQKSFMINPAFYQDASGQPFLPETRRGRQHGRFFVQPFPNAMTPLELQPELRPFLFKFIIDGGSKKQIKDELASFGLTTDWTYDRKDENIETEIQNLNNRIMNRCWV